MMPSHPTTANLRKAKLSQAGFSLVEVTMALGLMCFVSFGLLGLLPEGMSNMRKSMDNTIQAQITQELASMVQRTPFADLDALSLTYYYDGEGVLVEDSKKDRAVYQAEVIGQADVNKLVDTVWSDQNLPSHLRAVNIKITRKTAGAGDPGYQFMTYVANAGI